MNWRAFGETFVTLFVITDPIGNAPIFVAITRNLTPKQRQRAAVRAVLAAGALILGFAVFGEVVLRYLHVSVGSLSIAGGLLLMLVALEMLRGSDFPGGADADAPEDIALGPAGDTARRRARGDRDGDRALAGPSGRRRAHLRDRCDRARGGLRRARTARCGTRHACDQPGDPLVPDAGLRLAAVRNRGATRGGRRALADVGSRAPTADQGGRAMNMGLPRPRHGDPLDTTQELRALAAAVLREDVETLARTTDYLRRSYRVVFIGYVAMMIFGVGAIVAAFVKGLTAATIGEAVASVGLAGLTVGIFVAFFVQRPSAALERNAIFMPWVSIVLTTFWTRLLYLDDPETLDAKLGHAAKEASEELSAIAMRYAVIDGRELTVAKEAARTRPVKVGP